MDDFQKRIAQLDLSLFGHVTSQSTDGDKRSLLALQLASQEIWKGYVYLEIGSYMGGSLQPHVVDPLCRQIISIDPRPYSLPDERGEKLSYWQNSTQGMLNALQAVPGADLKKIKTLEQGTDVLSSAVIDPRPHLCFIDGEHTDAAVLRDARFCLTAVRPGGCIAFHDANIVYKGIAAVVQELQQSGRPFRAFHLPDSVVFIELDDGRISQCEPVRAQLKRNCDGYLWSLIENDLYRHHYNLPLFKSYRRLKTRTWDRVAGRLRKGS